MRVKKFEAELIHSLWDVFAATSLVDAKARSLRVTSEEKKNRCRWRISRVASESQRVVKGLKNVVDRQHLAFLNSTYFPEYNVNMSSGLVEREPTAFSAIQNKAWRFSLKPCRERTGEKLWEHIAQNFKIYLSHTCWQLSMLTEYCSLVIMFDHVGTIFQSRRSRKLVFFFFFRGGVLGGGGREKTSTFDVPV